ncbi:unnamed protein product [Caenorhabditis auriculariae]|uniref:Zinc metalloproteinase n=1 Tax=Caenorhabditis auriculariae TaxID=2777116 RepID=A0A8S1H0M9_9PELO|nr:unnamed protein product [Caenorhabditis auriculariae]
MSPHPWLLTVAIILVFPACASPQYIANDVVSDYGEVKELLNSFYRRHARRYGNDYDPSAILITEPSLDQASTDKTEATVNRKIWTEVFENDIILTLPQAEALLKEPNSRKKRQANRDPRLFWTNLTISYEFYGGDDKWKNLIRSALKHVEQNVCFKFKENGGDKDGLRYYRGQGCWSNVGRVGGKQLVSIGYGCDGLGIVSHETLHALGLWHEQSRVDRDDFISIVADKITRGTQGNFAKRSLDNTDNLNQPYDMGSVMHYGSKAFAYDWTSDTIVTKDWRYQQTIGQRDGISFKDAKIINLRYCTGVCRVQLPCQNDGYTDPNNCGQCRCPSGYGGTYCQEVAYTSCGGTLTATASSQTLASGNALPNAYCIWRIKSRYGERIEISFSQVSLTCSNPCTSYVEVKANKEKTATGARLCCKTPGTFVSEGDDVVLIYKVAPDSQMGWLGFTLRYRTVGEPETTAPSTVAPTTTTESATTSAYWIKTASGGWIHWEKSAETFGTNDESNSIPDSIISPDGNKLDPQKRSESSEKHAALSTVSPAQNESTSSASEWGLWGEWSSCSQPCGGCGTRTRIRACYGGGRTCPGSNLVTETCNAQTCTQPKKGMICNGRLIMPCELISKLQFGSNNALNPRLRDLQHALPLPRIAARESLSKEKIAPESSFIKRVKRRTSNQLCEKKFIYQCPTALLTINVDYKDDVPRDSLAYQQSQLTSECCIGYTAQSGVCYKIN